MEVGTVPVQGQILTFALGAKNGDDLCSFGCCNYPGFSAACPQSWLWLVVGCAMELYLGMAEYGWNVQEN